jgi:DNA-binding Xre family transcriptional regulator
MNTKYLVDNIKRKLKLENMSYADLAKELGIAESSVKKMFAKRNFSLERLDQICDVLNVELLELVEIVNEEVKRVTRLTPMQEQTLVDDIKLLLIGYATMNYWRYDDIVHRYSLTEHEILDRLKILQDFGWLEFNSHSKHIRPLVSNRFDWIVDGPIDRFIKDYVVPEFLKDDFKAANAVYKIKNGALTDESKKIFDRKCLELVDLFDDLTYKDRHYQAANRERRGTTLVLACRPWMFGGFGDLAHTKD